MHGASYEPSRRREATGRNGGRRERVVGVAAVVVGRSDLLRASRRVVLALSVPDGGSPLAWVLALAFGLVCIATAAALRRLLLEAFVSPGPVSYPLRCW